MHTCSTSKSSPSSDQRVWWRDRLDLQHDGVVYMVENFCCRASPTNSREGERKVARLLGLGGRCVGGGGKGGGGWRRGGGGGGRGRTTPLYIEGGRPALAPPPILSLV